jgi:hypothetical protein
MNFELPSQGSSLILGPCDIGNTEELASGMPFRVVRVTLASYDSPLALENGARNLKFKIENQKFGAG